MTEAIGEFSTIPGVDSAIINYAPEGRWELVVTYHRTVNGPIPRVFNGVENYLVDEQEAYDPDTGLIRGYKKYQKDVKHD